MKLKTRTTQRKKENHILAVINWISTNYPYIYGQKKEERNERMK